MSHAPSIAHLSTVFPESTPSSNKINLNISSVRIDRIAPPIRKRGACYRVIFNCRIKAVLIAWYDLYCLVYRYLLVVISILKRITTAIILLYTCNLLLADHTAFAFWSGRDATLLYAFSLIYSRRCWLNFIESTIIVLDIFRVRCVIVFEKMKLLKIRQIPFFFFLNNQFQGVYWIRKTLKTRK